MLLRSGRSRTALTPAFTAVWIAANWPWPRLGRKARALLCTLLRIHACNRIFLSLTLRRCPSFRMRPACHLILSQSLDMCRSQFSLLSIIAPRKVIEVAGCTVSPSIVINSLRAADATFTKYLKRYLGIPYHANNSITHYLTSTVPLTTTLNTLRMTGLNAFTMPPEMHGWPLYFYN